jgi:hypothetical protein
MLRDAWHIYPEANQGEWSVSPLKRKVSVEEIILLMHAYLGRLEDITLFVDKCLAMC